MVLIYFPFAGACSPEFMETDRTDSGPIDEGSHAEDGRRAKTPNLVKESSKKKY